ncbi:MAG: hypothetical protein JWQ19_1146 [Subtercola sp.]|nr:hypothetical protein [Subtercola sp.]
MLRLAFDSAEWAIDDANEFELNATSPHPGFEAALREQLWLINVYLEKAHQCLSNAGVLPRRANGNGIARL